MTENSGFAAMIKSSFAPAERDWRKYAITAFGTLVGIGFLSLISMGSIAAPLLITSFAATAVLIYGVPKSPLAQPKNVFFGHLLSAIVGTVFAMMLGVTWLAVTLAVTVSILLMTATGTLHPSGGATAMACVQACATPMFILTPVMVGIVVMMAVAYLCNMMRSRCEHTRSDADANKV